MNRIKSLFAFLIINATITTGYAQIPIITRGSMYLNGNVLEMTESVSMVEDKFGKIVIGPQSEIRFIGFNIDGFAYEYRDPNGSRIYKYNNGELCEISYEGFEDLYVKLNGHDEFTYDKNQIRIDSFSKNGELREVKLILVNSKMQYLEEKKYDKDGKLNSIIKYEYINDRMVQYISYKADGTKSMLKSIEYDGHGNKVKIIEDLLFLKLTTYFDYYENGLIKSRISISSDKPEKVEFEYEFDNNLNVVVKREYTVEEKYGEIIRVLTKIYSTKYKYE